MTILQANRAAGWQTVPPLRLHVLPRHDGDGVGLTWPRKDPGIDKLKELAARIKVCRLSASFRSGTGVTTKIRRECAPFAKRTR